MKEEGCRLNGTGNYYYCMGRGGGWAIKYEALFSNQYMYE